MLLSVLIALGMCIATVASVWIGIELTFRPVSNEVEKRRVRIRLGASAVVLLTLTIWATVRSEQASNRSEQELNSLPQRIVAEFIRNTTPPLGLPSVSVRVAPPTGLVAAVDGDWGATAIGVATQILNFVDSQGEPPTRRPGETDLDFVIRSNAWYSNVMDQYKKQFGPQVNTLVKLLIDKGALDKQVGNLAKSPVNIMGIRALQIQLEAVGRKCRAR